MSWRSIAEQYYARIAELEDALGGARHVQSEMDARITELEAAAEAAAAWRHEQLTEARARIAELEAELARRADVIHTNSARIAEMEAERDRDRETLAQWMIANSYATGHGDTTADLLGELRPQVEAEQDRLKAALTEIGGMADIGLNIGPAIRTARAALSGEGVT